MLLARLADGVLGCVLTGVDAQGDEGDVDVPADIFADEEVRYAVHFVNAGRLTSVLALEERCAVAVAASVAAGATPRDRGRGRRCGSARRPTLGRPSAE